VPGGPYPARPLAALLDEARRGAAPFRVAAEPTGVAERVILPELRTGQHMLAHIAAHQPHPARAGYDSITPWTCRLRDVAVHGTRGILRLGDDVVADTLPPPGDARGDCTVGAAGVTLRQDGRRHVLGGRTLSLLGGDPGNFHHWMIDGIGRLALTAPGEIAAFDHVLVPALTADFQRDSLARAGIDAARLVTVGAGDVVEAADLAVPWSLTGGDRPHPKLRDFFARLAAAGPRAAPPAGGWPARVYVERRASARRRLVNEAELAAALAERGFAIVRLEALDLATQIGIFAHAGCIVAPHGAGLANVLFARPGALVVELHMDLHVHWGFRWLAALGGVIYDCVIGRHVRPEGAAPSDVHGYGWAVSVLHVLAAVEAGGG
jgi:capsular polysaccharide biosynthesis protein